ncbi:MAG: carbonic anhydrase [Proteobacteria bacterium]|nr:carbonic anhydrase [Pseudomonadota bacterium]
MKYTSIYRLIIAAIILGATSFLLVTKANSTKSSSDTPASISPQQVLQQLQEGNKRFIQGDMKNHDLLTQVKKTASKQTPVALVLDCMDSRTSPELIFDQGIGDIFVTRVAGNILNDDILGSMEYGAQVAGIKLIAVIGHTNCGAVQGACEQAQLGHLTNLLHKIQPAVIQATKEVGSQDCKKPSYINQIAKDNVLLVINEIQAKSPVIKKLLDDKKIGIIGGIQDLATGKVTFFDAQNVDIK